MFVHTPTHAPLNLLTAVRAVQKFRIQLSNVRVRASPVVRIVQLNAHCCTGGLEDYHVRFPLFVCTVDALVRDKFFFTLLNLYHVFCFDPMIAFKQYKAAGVWSLLIIEIDLDSQF